jgi:energy-coupling factor transport system permease protein
VTGSSRRQASPPTRWEPNRLAEQAATEARLPDFVSRPPEGFYRSLNPFTKLTFALAMTLVAFGVRSWLAPAIVLAIGLGIAAVLRLGRSLVPFLLVTVPLLVSIVLVNTLSYPGATDTIAQIGPFNATWTGLQVALFSALRIVAFAVAVGVFALTTTVDALLSDLERRGLGRRPIFVIGAAIGMVPRMIDRAREITDAQRARGLDTQGRIWRRVRGLVPLSGPLVLGALNEVEERTMALEARAFTAPGKRTVLRVMPDSGTQRALRWLVAIVAIALVIASVAGRLAGLP